MIDTFVFFETTDELECLTGLTPDELWKAGFDLDDFDWGFCSRNKYTTDATTEWGTENVPDYDAPSYAYFILSQMSDYCVGFKEVMYNEKYYYMLYHS